MSDWAAGYGRMKDRVDKVLRAQCGLGNSRRQPADKAGAVVVALNVSLLMLAMYYLHS